MFFHDCTSHPYNFHYCSISLTRGSPQWFLSTFEGHGSFSSCPSCIPISWTRCRYPGKFRSERHCWSLITQGIQFTPARPVRRFRHFLPVCVLLSRSKPQRAFPRTLELFGLYVLASVAREDSHCLRCNAGIHGRRVYNSPRLRSLCQHDVCGTTSKPSTP